MIARREVLAATSAIALAGCLGGGDGDANGDDEGNTEGTIVEGSVPDGPVTDAPIPEDPAEHTYATMGTGDGPTATYYGSWKCPYCGDFSTGFLGDIVTDYVEPGDVDLQYRAIAYIQGDPFLGPDAPRAAQAGLAVWNVDPDSYWTFHEHVFANLPPEDEQWATTEQLTAFAEQAGVEDVDAVATQVEEQAHESDLQATSEAATDAGVSSTPTLVVDGEAVNPLNEEDRTRTLLDQLADGA